MDALVVSITCSQSTGSTRLQRGISSLELTAELYFTFFYIWDPAVFQVSIHSEFVNSLFLPLWLSLTESHFMDFCSTPQLMIKVWLRILILVYCIFLVLLSLQHTELIRGSLHSSHQLLNEISNHTGLRTVPFDTSTQTDTVWTVTNYTAVSSEWAVYFEVAPSNTHSRSFPDGAALALLLLCC